MTKRSAQLGVNDKIFIYYFYCELYRSERNFGTSVNVILTAWQVQSYLRMFVRKVGDLLVCHRWQLLHGLVERCHHLAVARDVLGIQQLA